MEYILSFFWGYIEVAYFVIFNSAFLQVKHTKKISFLIFIISGILLTIIANLSRNQSFRFMFSYIGYVVLSIWLFQAPFIRRHLTAILCFIFSGIIDSAFLYGVSSFLGISLNELVWKKLTYTAVVTIGKFLALLLAWLVYKVRRHSGEQKVRTSWLLLTIIFPSVSLIMLSIIYLGYQDRNDLSTGVFVFSIGLAVANIAILYLIHNMEVQTQKEHELILMNRQMQIQTDSIVALEKSYRAQRQSTHEFRHHLETMSELLANNNTISALEYIHSLQKMQLGRTLCINSRHPIIDAVTNQKYQEAVERNIDMMIQVNDLSNISIETDAIVVLLSNLLDNAIEACERVDTEKTIQCRIVAGETLFISVRNSSPPVVVTGDIIPSSKSPKEEHGYGLQNIKRILAKLHAEYTYQYAEGWFEFIIEIPEYC